MAKYEFYRNVFKRGEIYPCEIIADEPKIRVKIENDRGFGVLHDNQVASGKEKLKAGTKLDLVVHSFCNFDGIIFTLPLPTMLNLKMVPRICRANILAISKDTLAADWNGCYIYLKNSFPGASLVHGGSEIEFFVNALEYDVCKFRVGREPEKTIHLFDFFIKDKLLINENVMQKGWIIGQVIELEYKFSTWVDVKSGNSVSGIKRADYSHALAEVVLVDPSTGVARVKPIYFW